MRRARRVLIAALGVSVALVAARGVSPLFAPDAPTGVRPADRIRIGGSRGAEELATRSLAHAVPITPGARGTLAVSASTPRTDERAARHGLAPSPDPGAEGTASHEPAWSWPHLDPPTIAPTCLTAHVTGHDPIGNRPVLLWRRGLDGAEYVMTTESDAEGRFDFGHLPIPNGDDALAVTSAIGDPLSASATPVTRGQLPPPAFGTMVEPEGIAISLHPAVLAGTLLVSSEDGAVQWRIEIDGSPQTLSITGEDVARNLSVVQIGPDGRRSPPTPIHVAAPGRRTAAR